MGNYIIVDGKDLITICDWTLENGDENHEIRIEWGWNLPVKVSLNDVPGSGYLDYDVDWNTFVKKDVPALQESNCIIEEEYTE